MTKKDDTSLREEDVREEHLDGGPAGLGGPGG